MLDLETTGIVPGCAILSIGAVAFDNEKLGPVFYSAINLQSCHDIGLNDNPRTLNWWENQTAEAREILDIARLDRTRKLGSVLQIFLNWIYRIGDPKTIMVWGNGATFDNAILAHAYEKSLMPLPWNNFNDRCYRTIKTLRPEIKINREGLLHHNALDDAKAQAMHLIQILGDLSNAASKHA